MSKGTREDVWILNAPLINTSPSRGRLQIRSRSRRRRLTRRQPRVEKNCGFQSQENCTNMTVIS